MEGRRMGKNKNAKPCLISCGILKREIEKLVEEGLLDVELCFLDEGLHMDYNLLEQELTQTIEGCLERDQRKIVVVYGDVCLGFNNEMKKLLEKYQVCKVDALNCIDCLLGGHGKLLEIDPEHIYFFLNPAFMNFWDRVLTGVHEEVRQQFSKLKGIILVDSLGDLDDFKEKIEEICDYTGLPILKRMDIGLDGLKKALLEAIEKLAQKPT